MKQAIAIVGLACRYPEASSPNELWENVLGQRRAFRSIPAQRLRRLPGQRVVGHIGFQTAALTTAAKCAIKLHFGMADLQTKPLGAPVELAVKNQAHSDTMLHGDDREV